MEVRFVPQGKRIDVAEGAPLLDALAAVGIELNVACGGEGTCGKCRVRLRSTDKPDQASTEALACQVIVHEPLTVEIPSSSILDMAIQAVASSELHDVGRGAPDGNGDPRYGVAVDLGTTTIAAELLDLRSGNTLAVVSRLNPQTSIGDDLVARIQYACDDDQGRSRLRGMAETAVDQMVGELCEAASVDRALIYWIVVSGNTAMQHAFTGLDLRGLAVLPFEPDTRDGLRLEARMHGLNVAPDATLYVLPVIGGFVGGDTVASILCREELARRREEDDDAGEPAMLIDIGTNGEIVLFADGQRTAASAAAGPAFEGARIRQGMRASPGAVERVTFDPASGDLRLETIGGRPASGICGSGLIDLAAELLRLGLITKEGRLLPPVDAIAASAPEAVVKRLTEIDGHHAIEIVSTADAANGEPIVLTQRDIRELQLASGAIRAGAITLLRRAGLQPDELKRLYIGGGFGQYIRRENAQRIGLLPPEIPAERIRFLGNTSLAGARMTLLEHVDRETIERIAAKTEHVDLSTDPDFQWTFAEAMLFPEP